jgi:methionyl-tRNA synthetase
MVEAVQTDVYVRALKAMEGKDRVVFFCADDQHGTPIEIAARKEGVPPEQFVQRFHPEHLADYRAFYVEHDCFYGTHSEENRLHSERIYRALQERGVVETRDVEQFYCEVDKRFLPDRFVRGTCPNCKTPDQYGDVCEKCGTKYEPTDLKDPRCALCGTPPVRRSSRHYFARLSDFQDYLKKWTSAPGRVQPEIKNFLDGWLSERLQDWDISREAPYFGFQIPGETDKYFYVWLDAPVGYMATADHYLKSSFREWWPEQPTDEIEPRSGVRIEHFIGKDIVYFHTLFWPAMLNASGDQRPSRVHVHGFLTVEGEKMSKSRGTFLNARQYLDAGLDPEWLRFFFASNLGPSPTDIDLTFSELKNRVNGELLNNVGNLANRALKLIWERYGGRLSRIPGDIGDPALAELRQRETAIGEQYRRLDTRGVVQAVLELSTGANARLQSKQPWKTGGEAGQSELTYAVNVARYCARWLMPIVPRFARGIESQTGAALEWGKFEWLEEVSIQEPSPLVRRVEDADIEKLTSQFKPKEKETGAPRPAGAGTSAGPMAPDVSIDQFGVIDLRAGRVLLAEKVPKKDKLLKLSVDLGEGAPRTIVSGVAKSYAPEELVGKMVVVVANLPPREFGKGLASHGMILFSGGGTREHTALELPADVSPGAKVK